MASTVTSTAPPSVQTEGQKDNGDPGQIGMDGSGCALAADLDEATIKRLGGLIKTLKGNITQDHMQDFQYLVVSPWQGIRKYKPFVRRTISTLTTESILPSWVFEAVKVVTETFFRDWYRTGKRPARPELWCAPEGEIAGKLSIADIPLLGTTPLHQSSKGRRKTGYKYSKNQSNKTMDDMFARFAKRVVRDWNDHCLWLKNRSKNGTAKTGSAGQAGRATTTPSHPSQKKRQSHFGSVGSFFGVAHDALASFVRRTPVMLLGESTAETRLIPSDLLIDVGASPEDTKRKKTRRDDESGAGAGTGTGSTLSNPTAKVGESSKSKETASNKKRGRTSTALPPVKPGLNDDRSVLTALDLTFVDFLYEHGMVVYLADELKEVKMELDNNKWLFTEDVLDTANIVVIDPSRVSDKIDEQDQYRKEWLARAAEARGRYMIVDVEWLDICIQLDQGCAPGRYRYWW